MLWDLGHPVMKECALGGLIKTPRRRVRSDLVLLHFFLGV